MKALVVVLGLALPALSSLRAQSPRTPAPETPSPGLPQAAPAPAPRQGFAAPPPTHRNTRWEKRHERRHGAPALANFDADRDGKISLPEFVRPQTELAEQQAKASFQERDRNGDGQLTTDELAPRVAAPAAKPQRVQPRARVQAVKPPAGPTGAKSAPLTSPSPQGNPALVPPPPPPAEGGVVEIAPPPNH